MKRAEYYEKKNKNKTKTAHTVEYLPTATSLQRPLFCFGAPSHGETGVRHHQIRKHAAGRWEGKKKGISRFSLSIVQIDRPIFLEYPGGGGVALRRGDRDLLTDPPKVTCPTLLFPVFCLISILEESKIQINFTFSCFLYFLFMI